VTHRGGRERDPRRFFICSQNLLLRTANSQPSPGAIKTKQFEPSACCPHVGSAAAKTHSMSSTSTTSSTRVRCLATPAVGCIKPQRLSEQQNDQWAHHRQPRARGKTSFPFLAPCRPGPDVVAPPASGLGPFLVHLAGRRLLRQTLPWALLRCPGTQERSGDGITSSPAALSLT
jgi:hypothetical protein